VELTTQNRDLALWRKTVEICQRCLDLDREMLAKIGPGELSPKDVEDYLDPKIWEQFIEAREDLVEFTTSSIHVLTVDGQKKVAPPPDKIAAVKDDFVEQSELESRIIKSLKEMVELEASLAKYLNENLSVLRETIDGLSKNQLLFTKYSKNNSLSKHTLFSSEV
jgi:hypothetical protein